MPANAGTDPSFSPYIALLFPFLFVGIWCAVCLLLSTLGGWGDLARRYPAAGIPRGVVLRGQSAQLRRFCNYNRCLTMVIAEEGLHLGVWPVLRLGHPPLLIPWQEIRDPMNFSILWMRNVSLGIGSPEVIRLTVSEKVFRQFPPATGGRGWPTREGEGASP